MVFNTKWSYDDIVIHIRDLFRRFINDIDFEVMVPMSGQLIKPSLPPGEELDGINLKSIFHQKVIYIRPFQKIILTETPQNICLSDNEFDASTVSVCSSFGIEEAQLREECVSHTERIEEAVRENEHFQEPARETECCTSEENDMELHLAIIKSLDDSNSSLQTVLNKLNSKITDEHVSVFNIYREEIFQCCIRSLQRKSFSPFSKISVMFSDVDNVTEGAIDAGGPSREMFRLVMKYLENSRLFTGSEYSKYVNLWNDLLDKRHYYYAGQLIALSLLHGGTGPNFFSKSLFSFITKGADETKVDIIDVNDVDLLQVVSTLQTSSDLEELKSFIIENPLTQVAGCTLLHSLDEKEQLIMSKLCSFNNTL